MAIFRAASGDLIDLRHCPNDYQARVGAGLCAASNGLSGSMRTGCHFRSPTAIRREA